MRKHRHSLQLPQDPGPWPPWIQLGSLAILCLTGWFLVLGISREHFPLGGFVHQLSAATIIFQFDLRMTLDSITAISFLAYFLVLSWLFWGALDGLSSRAIWPWLVLLMIVATAISLSAVHFRSETSSKGLAFTTGHLIIAHGVWLIFALSSYCGSAVYSKLSRRWTAGQRSHRIYLLLAVTIFFYAIFAIARGIDFYHHVDWRRFVSAKEFFSSSELRFAVGASTLLFLIFPIFFYRMARSDSPTLWELVFLNFFLLLALVVGFLFLGLLTSIFLSFLLLTLLLVAWRPCRDTTAKPTWRGGLIAFLLLALAGAVNVGVWAFDPNVFICLASDRWQVAAETRWLQRRHPEILKHVEPRYDSIALTFDLSKEEHLSMMPRLNSLYRQAEFIEFTSVPEDLDTAKLAATRSGISGGFPLNLRISHSRLTQEKIAEIVQAWQLPMNGKLSLLQCEIISTPAGTNPSLSDNKLFGVSPDTPGFIDQLLRISDIIRQSATFEVNGQHIDQSDFDTLSQCQACSRIQVNFNDPDALHFLPDDAAEIHTVTVVGQLDFSQPWPRDIALSLIYRALNYDIELVGTPPDPSSAADAARLLELLQLDDRWNPTESTIALAPKVSRKSTTTIHVVNRSSVTTPLLMIDSPQSDGIDLWVFDPSSLASIPDEVVTRVRSLRFLCDRFTKKSPADQTCQLLVRGEQLERFANLESLDLGNHVMLDDFRPLTSLASLARLRVRLPAEGDRDDASHFSAALAHLRNLRSLSLDGALTRYDAEAISSLPKLVLLELGTRFWSSPHRTEWLRTTLPPPGLEDLIVRVPRVVELLAFPTPVPGRHDLENVLALDRDRLLNRTEVGQSLVQANPGFRITWLPDWKIQWPDFIGEDKSIDVSPASVEQALNHRIHEWFGPQ